MCYMKPEHKHKIEEKEHFEYIYIFGICYMKYRTKYMKL